VIIGLDYDDTWTRDPEGWFTALLVLKRRNTLIYGVTMRHPHEAGGMDHRYDTLCEKVFFTGRKAKKKFVNDRGLIVDVWIDDNPIWVEVDAIR